MSSKRPPIRYLDLYKVKHRNISRRSSKTSQNVKNNTKQKSVLNFLPQGIGVRFDWIKESSQSILKWPEIMNGKVKEEKELSEYHKQRLAAAQQMTGYVSKMMKDYITSDNIWKIVTKTSPYYLRLSGIVRKIRINWVEWAVCVSLYLENSWIKKFLPNVDDIKNKIINKTSEPIPQVPKFIQKREKYKDLYFSQAAVDTNTIHVMSGLKLVNSEESADFRLKELNKHLDTFPLSRTLANKYYAQEIVIKLGSKYPNLSGLCAEVLARLGQQTQLNNSKGLRILSIDGGGMKGLLALEVLRHLEEKTGKKIYQLFDYMIGVSTGSIIIGLLAFKRLSVREVTKLYEELGAEVFQQSYLAGMTGMVQSQAYYNTSKYEAILKEYATEQVMAETVRHPDCPKVAFVSAIMSASRHSVTPFMFRNYMVTSNFRGSSRFKVWEAIRASSAAPGFFDEFCAKGQVFQDGALIANNPSTIGYHESHHLWPKEKLQCLVSLGMGRYEPLLIDPYEIPETKESLTYGVKDKFSKLVLSATDTEMTHYTLNDMLSDDKYFRFNPYLSEIISMDEVRPEKMSVLQNDSQMYCRRNMRRLDLVSQLTTAQPDSIQRAKRNLVRSFETSNNSLTAALNSIKNSTSNGFSISSNSSTTREIREKADYISFSKTMDNISEKFK